MKGATHVYAVVRIDRFQQNRNPGVALKDVITVKEILPTLEEAQAEVERLMALVKGRDIIYFWQTTRFLPQGRSAVRKDSE
jgi:hypothetical protein